MRPGLLTTRSVGVGHARPLHNNSFPGEDPCVRLDSCRLHRPLLLPDPHKGMSKLDAFGPEAAVNLLRIYLFEYLRWTNSKV